MALCGAVYGWFSVQASVRLMQEEHWQEGPFADAASQPSITILKPLHGDEPGLFGNLESFLLQEYNGTVQIVFGVASADDPAVATVEALRLAYPDRDIHCEINAAQHGRNPKVSNLINMHQSTRGDIVVLADSDIRVAPTYLSVIVRALARPGTGAVSCLYRGKSTGHFWSKLSMLGIDAHFLPNSAFAIAHRLATPCFGSTIALRRDTLVRIGGFEALADQLADDYALGTAVRALGLAVTFPPMLVDHVCSESDFRTLWSHDLRWARTIRAVNPAGYAGSFLTNPVPLGFIGMLLSGFAMHGIAITLAVTLSRILAIRRLRGIFSLSPASTTLLVLRDLLSFAVFIWSFSSRQVEWRGVSLDVGQHGALQETTRASKTRYRAP